MIAHGKACFEATPVTKKCRDCWAQPSIILCVVSHTCSVSPFLGMHVLRPIDTADGTCIAHKVLCRSVTCEGSTGKLRHVCRVSAVHRRLPAIDEHSRSKVRRARLRAMLSMSQPPQHARSCAGAIGPQLVQPGLVLRCDCSQRRVPGPCCVVLADGAQAVVGQPVADALRVKPAQAGAIA